MVVHLPLRNCLFDALVKTIRSPSLVELELLVTGVGKSIKLGRTSYGDRLLRSHVRMLGLAVEVVALIAARRNQRVFALSLVVDPD